MEDWVSELHEKRMRLCFGCNKIGYCKCTNPSYEQLPTQHQVFIPNLLSMSDSADSIPRQSITRVRQQPLARRLFEGASHGWKPSPSCSLDAEEQFQKQRRESLRLASGTPHTPQHLRTLEKERADSVPLRHEGQGFSCPPKRLRPGELCEHRGTKRIDVKPNNPVNIDGIDPGRLGRSISGLSALASIPDGALLGIQILQGTPPWLCKGPGDSGPCHACRRFLHIMEQRDCFLAESESEETEGSSTEATLDPGSSSSGEDIFIDVDGNEIPTEDILLAEG